MTLTLPPPGYARKGGEIIAAQLAKVGINAKIENVEWAQWLSGPFKGNFDLTMISHVEPLDFDRYADPELLLSATTRRRIRDLVTQYNSTHRREEPPEAARRHPAPARHRRAGRVFMFQLPQFAVSKKNLKGLWSSSPIFANDLGALSWQ